MAWLALREALKPPVDSIPDPEEMERLLQRLMRGVNKMFLDAVGGKSVVMHGPFKGMIIPTAEEECWADGNYSCKMLGVYEHELHDAIAHAVSRQPKAVINIGCGDGYYAIGLARLLPDAWIGAFDQNDQALATCKEFSRRNGVEVVCARGCTSPLALGMSNDPGHRLYVLDCEGAERTLLDPAACPELTRSDIIVECHDFLDKDCSMKIASRFATTHAIEIIRPRLPLFSRYEFLEKTPGVTQVLMLTEKRPMPTIWLACWAHQRGD